MIKKAKAVQCGEKVRFTTGQYAQVVGRFSTGDGTITLIFKRGDKVWKRRMYREMELVVD